MTVVAEFSNKTKLKTIFCTVTINCDIIILRFLLTPIGHNSKAFGTRTSTKFAKLKEEAGWGKL